MQRKAGQIPSLEELRRRAERTTGAGPALAAANGGPAELAGLVRELEVHQAMLGLQSETLQATSVELQTSQDRFFEIYDLAPVGHLTLDLAGTILEANNTATALTGMDQAHLVGHKLSSLMSAADGDRFHLHGQEALGGSAAVVCEVSLRKSGGEVCPVYIRSKALRNLQGAPEGFLCVLFDLSDLRRAEQKLQAEEARSRESEARLREIAEHVEDALMLREQDGTFAYVSPAFERIWARPAALILNDAAVWEASLHPADRGRLHRAQARLEGGAPFEETFRILRPGDEIRWVRARFFPFKPMPGGRPRYVGVAQDVTAARAREEELRQAQKMEAVGSLASAIAHDFGNLLQGIMGCTSVVRASDSLPERRQEYLDRILEAVKRGSGLVGQLMVFSRKKSSEPRPIRLDEIIRDLAALLERLLGEHIRLEVGAAAPDAVILADSVQIEQILMNLAANARDAMLEGGTLTIETRIVPADQTPGAAKPGRAVRLTVRDTGAGMDEPTRVRIFEPFFTTKPSGVGTGIGLSTVLGITRGLGGSVEVDSELGRGTCFVFQFPCVEARPAVAVGVGAGRQRRFRGRVLLIEDHHLVRVTVRHYLEELGLEVLEASGAVQALELCEANPGPIALCVSDVTLPGASGPKVMRQLRARYPSLRSLFITAHPTGELVARGVIEENMPALQKPFGKPELAAKLATILPGN